MTVRAQQPQYDLLIRGGTVVDGTGAPGYRADIAVKGARIAAVRRSMRGSAARTIDASGLIVAPGFIDVHTHADDIAANPSAANFARMGVTTVIAGNCGGSALDIADALAKIRDTGIAINYGTLIGHNTVRRAVMGTADRPPSAGELSHMKALVWKGMADGALGFSTGLQYVPGTYAGFPEIVELARVAANAGGVYASHMRNEGTELEKAVAETIRIGEATGVRVEISHLKVDSPKNWGGSARALAQIDAARAKGVDVQADVYAYTAASSSLGIRFPAWALEGGDAAVARRLEDPSMWDRIKREMASLLADRGLDDLSFAVVAFYGPDRTFNGLSMKEVAVKLAGSDTADAQFEAARRMMLAGGASMVYHFMSDDDVRRIMAHPFVSIASDAGVLAFGAGVPHPRGYGNNARVLARYVRDQHVLSIEQAVRKMSALPADHFRIPNRGAIRAGMFADLVLFDASQVADTATYENPHQYAAGIPFVIVNGRLVVDNGMQTSERPGQVIAKSLLLRTHDPRH
jgi:N-acyl-D-amino-acid deacylase